jgi:hypothetical protein
LMCHHLRPNTEKPGKPIFSTRARIFLSTSWSRQIVVHDVLYHPTFWNVQKYTGDSEICGPQNGDKWPKMTKNRPKQPKMDKSGHFASHISHYPLYIFDPISGGEPSRKSTRTKPKLTQSACAKLGKRRGQVSPSLILGH